MEITIAKTFSNKTTCYETATDESNRIEQSVELSANVCSAPDVIYRPSH